MDDLGSDSRGGVRSRSPLKFTGVDGPSRNICHYYEGIERLRGCRGSGPEDGVCTDDSLLFLFHLLHLPLRLSILNTLGKTKKKKKISKHCDQTFLNVLGFPSPSFFQGLPHRCRPTQGPLALQRHNGGGRRHSDPWTRYDSRNRGDGQFTRFVGPQGDVR